MDYDITRLTFQADPQAYRAQSNEICVRVPAGLTTEGTLLDFLSTSLPLPPNGVHDWNRLAEVLRYWGDWQSVPQRVVILHTDVPFGQTNRLGWLDLQTYVQFSLKA